MALRRGSPFNGFLILLAPSFFVSSIVETKALSGNMQISKKLVLQILLPKFFDFRINSIKIVDCNMQMSGHAHACVIDTDQEGWL